MRRLYRGLSGARAEAGALGERLAVEEGSPEGGVLEPAEEVSDFLHRRENHFPELEEAAEALHRRAELDPAYLRLGLIRWLEREHGVDVVVHRVVHVPHMWLIKTSSGKIARLPNYRRLGELETAS